MILDTNALSAFVDGESGVRQALRREVRAAIPVIVLGEFRYGIAGSRHRAAYEAWLEDQLPHFEILTVTDGTAVALQHRLPVLSRDEHFDAVAGVERRGW